MGVNRGWVFELLVGRGLFKINGNMATYTRAKGALCMVLTEISAEQTDMPILRRTPVIEPGGRLRVKHVASTEPRRNNEFWPSNPE